MHIVTAVIGPYARIGLAATVIPFISPNARSWLGLGVIAADLMLAIILTSLLRRHLSHRTWQTIHWLAHACWPIALAHSLGTGGGRSGLPLRRVRQEGSSGHRLQVDPIACTGHGLCAELLPELIALDKWGYPLLKDQPVPLSLARRARRAVSDCPALALRLIDASSVAAPADSARVQQ